MSRRRTSNSHVYDAREPVTPARRPNIRQNTTPGGSAVVGRTVLPSASSVWSTRVQHRSAHTSTRAPVVPSGRIHRNDGRCDVTRDTDCGRTGRGGAIVGSPSRTPPSPRHSLPGGGPPIGSMGTTRVPQVTIPRSIPASRGPSSPGAPRSGGPTSKPWSRDGDASRPASSEIVASATFATSTSTDRSTAASFNGAAACSEQPSRNRAATRRRPGPTRSSHALMGCPPRALDRIVFIVDPPAVRRPWCAAMASQDSSCLPCEHRGDRASYGPT